MIKIIQILFQLSMQDYPQSQRKMLLWYRRCLRFTELLYNLIRMMVILLKLSIKDYPQSQRKMLLWYRRY